MGVIVSNTLNNRNDKNVLRIVADIGIVLDLVGMLGAYLKYDEEVTMIVLGLRTKHTCWRSG